MIVGLILIAFGILFTVLGFVKGIALAIQCWWLLCQICFKKDLQKISYDIPFRVRFYIAGMIVVGITTISMGLVLFAMYP